MLARVFRTITEHQLLRPGQRVLVGLSGGPDSWALLLALAELSRARRGGVAPLGGVKSGSRRQLAGSLPLTLEAACVDHGLRPESRREAAEVAAQCRARGIACAVLRVKVKRRSGGHVSVQEAARDARLGALEKHAKKRRCTAIALAHQADDQAETILFRIVRGTGVRGLAGIPYRRSRFVRPLLDVRRAEIERYLRRLRVVPVADPSNADPRFSRSRVRHEWLPLLEKENPRLVDALLSLGRDARAQERASGSESTRAGAPGNPLVTDGKGGAVFIHRRAAEVVRQLLSDGARVASVDVRGGRVEVRAGRALFVPGNLRPSAR